MSVLRREPTFPLDGAQRVAPAIPPSPHMSTVLITTPTGHIGTRVVDQLLADGTHRVRVLARDPSRLAPAVRERADVRPGALDAVAVGALDGLAETLDPAAFPVAMEWTRYGAPALARRRPPCRCLARRRPPWR